MLADLNSLIAAATAIYGDAEESKPFKLVDAANRVRSGSDPAALAAEIRSTRKRILEVAGADDPIQAVFKLDLAAAARDDMMAKARKGLGQMLLGTLAERSFEESYRNVVQRDELRLEDSRSGRTDTDYRVFDERDRPVFRINIKFHGSPFRKARELVGLDPHDCFALATYKIQSAIQKQEREFLPYLFVVVSVPGLTGEHAGGVVPEDLAHLTALYMGSSQPRKRDFEDLVVRYLVDMPQEPAVGAAVDDIWARIQTAPWRVISARRANRLLHDFFFERVYAVRVRGFASNYNRAEVDMHFSIHEELTSLEGMLEILRDHGLQGLTGRIERGEI